MLLLLVGHVFGHVEGIVAFRIGILVVFSRIRVGLELGKDVGHNYVNLILSETGLRIATVHVFLSLQKKPVGMSGISIPGSQRGAQHHLDAEVQVAGDVGRG